MKVYGLTLAIIRTFCLWIIIDSTVHALIYPLFPTSLKNPLWLDETAYAARILAFGALFFFSKPVARFISDSNEDIPLNVDFLTVGFRLLGAWFILSAVEPIVVDLMTISRASNDFLLSSQTAHMHLEGYFASSLLGILLILFAPTLTRLISKMDDNAKIRREVAEALQNDEYPPTEP